MIAPTALNVLIIGASMLLFSAFWRFLAVRYADTSTGKAMSLLL